MELDLGDPYYRGTEHDRGVDPLRLVGVVGSMIALVVGVVLMVAGTILAVTVFNVVKDTIVDPDAFFAFVDRWEGESRVADAPSAPVEAVQAPAAEPTAETNSADGTVAKFVEDDPAAPGKEPETDSATGDDASAPDAPLKITNQGAQTAVSKEDHSSESFGAFLDRIFEFVSEGGMSRTMGGAFMVVLLVLLSRIPFLFITTGFKLVSGNLPDRKGNRVR